jgi:hypothetical protein
MKRFVETNPLSAPETAARKLIDIANTVEPAQDGRIYIELVNRVGGTGAGKIHLAIAVPALGSTSTKPQY